MENEIEKEILDEDEFTNTEIKINPEFYIHNAVLKAQASLEKENLKEGYLRYYLYIEHIEILAKSANIIGDDYDTEIKKFQEEKDYIDTKDDLIKNTKLANKKLSLVMKAVFSKKIITNPMRY